MIPIVDAGVSLSRNGLVLLDYLNKIKRFHVLRVVAVQRPSNNLALSELDYLQSQAMTRGLGGFPNAIIASVDLLKPDTIAQLVVSDTLKNLRGVYCCFDDRYEKFTGSTWKQSLDILAAHNLSLDVCVSEVNHGIIVQMAEYRPDINMVINLSGSKKYGATKSLERIAQYSQVYLKIGGGEALKGSADLTLDTLINNSLDWFGCDRVMFASGVDHQCFGDSFDELWAQYVRACSSVSAKGRNSLFRTTAIKVYRL